MSEVTPQEETAVLLKYGDRETAMLMWWGRSVTTETEWERRVVVKWQKEEWEAGLRG